MQIDHLELRNFRGFEHFEIDLHPRATVLIGDNGSGKSSILDALAIAAGSWFLGFVSEPLPSRTIRPEEVRRVKNGDEHRLAAIERQFPVSVVAGGHAQGRPAHWRRELRSEDGKTTWADAKELKAIAAEAQQGVMDGEENNLPVLVYYGAGRLWLQKSQTQAKTDSIGSRLMGYLDALDTASSQKLLEAWMRRLEYARSGDMVRQVSRGETVTRIPNEPHLAAVEQPVVRCVPDAEAFYFDLVHQELRAQLRDGRILPFSLLSDGYRNFIGMVADIAWRTVQLNPHLAEEAPRETPGIVLIDELELHLHPGWQRLVLGALLDAFPKIQFVVTTHSPQVIASARQDWMRLLKADRREALSTRTVQGKDSNAILEDVMHVPARPREMKRKLEELARFLEFDQLDKARSLLAEVSEILGADDTEVVSATWELSIAEAAEKGSDEDD